LNPAPANADTPLDPLTGLRPYHLPDAVSWWPPAPGWWLLLLITMVLIFAIVWWFNRRHRCHAAARQAARELERLRSSLSSDRDTAVFVRGLSRLLRRYVLAAFPGQPVAALTGDAWLNFLDNHGGAGRFQNGPGRQLIEAPYRPAAQVAADELAELVSDWIRHNREVCP
jgi:hypothetical protein